MKVFAVVCTLYALVATSFGDVSSIAQAPYQSAGWRPSVGLAAPQQQPTNVEVSEQNVQFVGQVRSVVPVATASIAAPNNAYLPPPQESQRVQALPQDTSPIVFTSQIKQLNTGEVFFLPQPQISQYRQAPAQFRQVPKQFRKQEFRTTTEFQQQQPAFQQQGQQFRQQPAIQQQQPTFAASSSARIQTAPAGQFEPQYSRQEVYGPPPAPAPLPAEAPEPEQPGNEPPVNGENDDDNDDTNDGPVIAVANASTNGQYYILTKDNTLQRVVYQTAQTEDDIINNGFTAQLRYAPVEPIRDPIYAYNTQGQLVKIYNK